ncbi:gastrolith protein 10 [Penaeus vannamei]|uniref:Gastrolith protein 10 n=1 Tax=Penaeus vannamei TaxID=6689 RepID=A0A423SP76_PENVA|nr:gastrolith protein 10 [Penaeus vannamei]
MTPRFAHSSYLDRHACCWPPAWSRPSWAPRWLLSVLTPALPPSTSLQSFREKVYGEGLNNPAALPPNTLAFNRAKHIVTNIRPDLRVRVNIDGTVELTNIYGQEVDDELIFPDLEEIQEQRLQAQKLAILRRRQEQDAQLIREFNLGGNAQDFGLGNLGGANQGGFTI